MLTKSAQGSFLMLIPAPGHSMVNTEQYNKQTTFKVQLRVHFAKHTGSGVMMIRVFKQQALIVGK